MTIRIIIITIITSTNTINCKWKKEEREGGEDRGNERENRGNERKNGSEGGKNMKKTTIGRIQFKSLTFQYLDFSLPLSFYSLSLSLSLFFLFSLSILLFFLPFCDAIFLSLSFYSLILSSSRIPDFEKK